MIIMSSAETEAETSKQINVFQAKHDYLLIKLIDQT